jgi:hypothetical protein
MNIPKNCVLVLWPTGEAAIWARPTITYLEQGTIQATVIREAKTLADLEAWMEREPMEKEQ